MELLKSAYNGEIIRAIDSGQITLDEIFLNIKKLDKNRIDWKNSLISSGKKINKNENINENTLSHRSIRFNDTSHELLLLTPFSVAINPFIVKKFYEEFHIDEFIDMFKDIDLIKYFKELGIYKFKKTIKGVIKHNNSWIIKVEFTSLKGEIEKTDVDFKYISKSDVINLLYKENDGPAFSVQFFNKFNELIKDRDELRDAAILNKKFLSKEIKVNNLIKNIHTSKNSIVLKLETEFKSSENPYTVMNYYKNFSSYDFAKRFNLIDYMNSWGYEKFEIEKYKIIENKNSWDILVNCNKGF